MSSFHGDENVASPSLPRTPASPVVNNESSHSKNSKKGDVFAKLFKLGEEPERKLFLEKLMIFNEERGCNQNNLQCPSVNKNLLDLFKFYALVRDRGGFAEICKSRKWKEVTGIVVGRESSAPLANTVKKHYIKFILPYECKFDRNNIDPQQLIAQIEAPKEKKKLNNSSSGKSGAPSPAGVDSNSQSSYPQATTPVSSDGSNLSSANKSNGQQIANDNKFNNNNTPTITQSTPTKPVLKQQQSTNTSTFNPNNSLNNNQNQKPIMPNYGPPSNVSQQQQMQSPFRPPSTNNNNQYPMMISDPNSSDNSLNNSLNNSLSHNEQFPSATNQQQQQLNTSNSSLYPHHHLNADHYQNMSRTHSPLAQRLMQQQQKSPVVSCI